MLASLGHEVSPAGVARMYEGSWTAWSWTRWTRRSRDRALGMRVLATGAVMRDVPDRARLAREVLGFGAGLVAL